MWPFSKERKVDISYPVAAAIIISVVSLAASAATARWSWLILEEQVKLRKEFVELQAMNEQLKVQFDFWDKQVQKEREQLRAEMQKKK